MADARAAFALASEHGQLPSWSDQFAFAAQVALDPRVQGRYRRLVGRRGRAVVPVIRGTCYGCFVSVPTALASDADRNEELRYCESCGRFLYLID